LSYSILVTIEDERSFDVLVKDTKNTQRGGQKSYFKFFSKPWLAWAPKWLRGEVTNSPGRARLLQVEVRRVAKRVILRFFLNPGSPMLAFGSPGPPNGLGVK